ncbi:hypothetical protein H257_16860 [Aphanomyces astaci]|uniref:Uncharacterized protein n=1 Tax=Aphanomyces astaci TaxID=112090 RepID=W4FH43_APHAT|nr:hypothetical protein H257_16860 [Aphanomyces astaci]ETV66775.1 hypothetical protein H257_16860 [Aphanomyces astaci]|eukprot:XP_009843751.1 hypothetical protein H257_16860 [Aphanomyces astaci]
MLNHHDRSALALLAAVETSYLAWMDLQSRMASTLWVSLTLLSVYCHHLRPLLQPPPSSLPPGCLGAEQSKTRLHIMWTYAQPKTKCQQALPKK